MITYCAGGVEHVTQHEQFTSSLPRSCASASGLLRISGGASSNMSLRGTHSGPGTDTTYDYDLIVIGGGR